MMNHRIATGRREGAVAADLFIVAALLTGGIVTDSFQWFALAALGYFLVRDGFMNGRSPGKLVAGLRVVSLPDMRPANVVASIKRNGVIVLELGGIALLTQALRVVAGDKVAAAGCIGAFMGYLAYYAVGFQSGDFRSLADRLAGTAVIPETQPTNTSGVKLLLTVVAWIVGLSLIAAFAFGLYLAAKGAQ